MSDTVSSLSYSYEYSIDKWKQAKGEHYGRLTGHSLHYIGPYSGSFPPELVHYFLQKYSDPNDVILDPFSGRGTTGLQTVLAKRIAIANDLNPLAYIYSFAKLFPFSSFEVDRFLDHVPWQEKNYATSLSDDKKSELLAYFHPDTLSEIQNLRHYLLQNDTPIGKYTSALLAGISQGNRISNLSVTMSALICFSAKYMRNWSAKTGIYPEYREVRTRLVAKAERLEADGLHFRRDSIVMKENALNLPLEEHSVDLIITSPPYFNVINYAYDNRVRLWLIGHEYRDVQKCLIHTSSIEKYSLFIQKAISEMYRVLKDDSWAIIVVGDVKRTNSQKGNDKRRIIINTAEIVASAAEKHGFRIEKIINDSLPIEGGTCGRATSLTDRFNVSLDRCVVLKKGRAEERNHEINWQEITAKNSFDNNFSAVSNLA
jgi:site-specific DNA-methyltransferase (adenine-specific)